MSIVPEMHELLEEAEELVEYRSKNRGKWVFTYTYSP